MLSLRSEDKQSPFQKWLAAVHPKAYGRELLQLGLLLRGAC